MENDTWFLERNVQDTLTQPVMDLYWSVTRPHPYFYSAFYPRLTSSDDLLTINILPLITIFVDQFAKHRKDPLLCTYCPMLR